MKTRAPAARIPIPLARRWLAFREQLLPAGVFAAAALTAAVLWHTHIAAPSVVAEAELITSEVRALQAGTIATLDVVPMQRVHAGQPLGFIRVAEPAVTSATLAVIRATITSLRTGMEPVADARRTALESARLQLEWMQARVDLAELRAQLQLAEDDLRRTGQLHAGGVTTDEALESARTIQAGLVSRVEAQHAMVERLAPTMDTLSQATEAAGPSHAAAALEAAIQVEEEQLRLAELQLAPVPLVAAIDGTVGIISRRPGESVVAGDAILTIASAQSARVIGYLRQPLALEPAPGTVVEIRTHRARRTSAPATVLDVAPNLEPISPTLLAALRTPAPELGLRIHFTAPEELALRPGEHVDVIFHTVATP